MKSKCIAVFIALALCGLSLACGENGGNSGVTVTQTPCASCAQDKGGVGVGLWASGADVSFITVTIDTAPTFTETFAVTGGTFSNHMFVDVPVGSDLTMTLEGKPDAADPDKDVVIFRTVYTGLNVAAGQVTTVSGLKLVQVVGSVPVKAVFPTNDYDVASVSYVTVNFEGPRVDNAVTFYMSKPSGNPAQSLTQDGSSDNKTIVPVGSGRTVIVAAFNASDELLHAGTSEAFNVVESSNGQIEVTMENMTGKGKVDASGNSCTPDCSGRVCGSDGCGGSCGGCKPTETCASGVCQMI